MHGRTGNAKEADVLVTCDSFLSLHPLVLVRMLLEGSLIASLPQREGEDHIPEQRHGCQSEDGGDGTRLGEDPEHTLGIRSETSPKDDFRSEHLITT